MAHREAHRTEHIGWLRAAVLGANDGLISTSSLVVGVAAAQSQRGPILLAATAGLVAGALSMAAGEYVSVSSQSDTEQADLALERHELAADPEFELAELAGIYEGRGLTKELAAQVAQAQQAAQAGQAAVVNQAQRAAAQNLAQAAQQLAQQAAQAAQGQQQMAAMQQAMQELAQIIVAEQNLQVETAASVAKTTGRTAPVPGSWALPMPGGSTMTSYTSPETTAK